MGTNLLLHRLRNGYGLTEDERRSDRLEAADEIERWKDPMLALLRRWAKDTQCDAIEFTGRKGWIKLFAKDGNQVQWVTCELPLGE